MKEQSGQTGNQKQPGDKTCASPVWHTFSINEVRRKLDCPDNNGLTEKEAQIRLELYGPNSLTLQKKEPFWKEFLEELENPWS